MTIWLEQHYLQLCKILFQTLMMKPKRDIESATEQRISYWTAGDKPFKSKWVLFENRNEQMKKIKKVICESYLLFERELDFFCTFSTVPILMNWNEEVASLEPFQTSVMVLFVKKTVKSFFKMPPFKIFDSVLTCYCLGVCPELVINDNIIR